jgi:hypothetical protein
MPKARINRAANAAAEPSHSLKGSRALQDSASHRHRLPACHLTQPDAASTRPSMNTVGPVKGGEKLYRRGGEKVYRMVGV